MLVMPLTSDLTSNSEATLAGMPMTMARAIARLANFFIEKFLRLKLKTENLPGVGHWVIDEIEVPGAPTPGRL